MNVIEIKSDQDIKNLVDLRSDILDENDRERVINDFKSQCFRGFFCLSEKLGDEQSTYSIDSIKAYVLIHYAYSTWQNRIFSLFDLWIRPNLPEDDKYKFLLVKCLIERLFSEAREMNCKRINCFLTETGENKSIINWLHELGIKNLTDLEDWRIFEMQLGPMKELIDDKCSKKIPDTYKIITANEINKYAQQIRDCIFELATFEKLADQFECELAGLLDDYGQFYQSIVVIDRETNNLVGFSIYFIIYDLKRGRGCLIEDIYIKEKFRGQGLGTTVWKRVLEDCIEKGATFTQWPVLAWNHPAIQFYFKLKSVDLTQQNKLHFYRFITSTIYAKN